MNYKSLLMIFAALSLVWVGTLIFAKNAELADNTTTVTRQADVQAVYAKQADLAAEETGTDAQSEQNRISDQLEQYRQDRTKPIHELQPFRTSASIQITDGTGLSGTATLINLNPQINVWFILELAWDDASEPVYYHIENRFPKDTELTVELHFAMGIQIMIDRQLLFCDLWSAQSSALAVGRASGTPFVSLCDGQIYLRNQSNGRKTTVEKITDLLREHVWGSEKIIDMVKSGFYQDAFMETSDLIPATAEDTVPAEEIIPGPKAPLIQAHCAGQCLLTTQLGITLDQRSSPRAVVGKWYPVRGIEGVFAGTMQPKLVAEEVIQAQKGKVNPLSGVESAALVYLVAFDLSKFELGYELGTEHPWVRWSNRPPPQSRDASMPGPDGIGSVAPLARTGIVTPDRIDRLVATFTGGFKRYHGAFRASDFAFENHGTHYGFVENGVVLSKLMDGLSTVVVDRDGSVDLRTWDNDDPNALQNIRHARQNGVPIISFDEETGTSDVGTLVRDKLRGNWSASAEINYRTVRAGLALQENEGRRYLIYAYFSSATVSAMARVFGAYQVKYAMILDMNALEHTYLALYRNSDSHFLVEQLVKGMDVLDTTKQGEVIPRFVGYSDNRDFFYLLRKE